MDPGASAPSDQPPENSPPDHPLPDNLGHATATRRRDPSQFEEVVRLRAVRGRNRSDSVPGPASRLAIAVILTPALATRDRAGDASNLPAVNDRVRTTDRCLLGLASQDCEEPVNSLALIDGQGAVGLGEEGHRAPVAGPTAHILAERTRHPHNRQRPGMGDNRRILLLGVGLAAYEQDARLSQVVSDPVHSGKPRVTYKRDFAISQHLASPNRRSALQGRRRADETKRGLGHVFRRYSTSPSRLPLTL